jgi:hypothetical protein
MVNFLEKMIGEGSTAPPFPDSRNWEKFLVQQTLNQAVLNGAEIKMFVTGSVDRDRVQGLSPS